MRNKLCFRPLAGVNYNGWKLCPFGMCFSGFRPLAGVNYNRPPDDGMSRNRKFPSPCGGEL